MPYPIVLSLPDTGSTDYPGFLYLPGEAVPGLAGWSDPSDPFPVLCGFCSTPIGLRGTLSPETGEGVPQHPATGDHDGIVSGIYSPVQGARPMESDYSHLRCVVESCEMGSAVLTVAAGNPYRPTPEYAPAHESGTGRVIPATRSATGSAALVTR